MTDQSSPLTFSDLDLSDAVQQAVLDSGYQTPSPIQAAIIPELLAGKDVLGVAQTGTGKTAAFALPILSQVDTGQKKPQVLCLTPTRELAIQVAGAFKDYAKHIKNLNVLAVYGGASYRDQSYYLNRGVQVVVGTPGRLMDLIDRKNLKLDCLKTMVLDEADEMLRMGFIDDVEWILKHTPDNHQTALFSATMPPQIRKITQKYLNSPVEITIKSKTTTNENISQYFLPLVGKKLNLLHKVLEVTEFDACIIFTKTRNGCNDVTSFLQRQNYRAETLNGDVAQDQREKIVAKLKRGDIDVIVATDVAARGLDVKRISLVINYDLPADTETYTHRIGRTGRAGNKGDAILFVEGRRMRLVSNIERATKQKIAEFEFPSAETLNERKLQKTFERIDAELTKDLSEYTKVIEKYLVHSPVDPTVLAVALASIEAKGKTFFVKDMPKPKFDRDEGYGKSSDKKRKPRSDSRDKRSEGRFDRDDRQSNRNGGRFDRDNESTEGFLLAVGEEHGATKGDIVGAIANEAGVDSKLIGKIQVFSQHSLIDLPKGMPDDVFQALQNVRVRGHKIKIKRGGADQENYRPKKNPKGKSEGDFKKKSKLKLKDGKPDRFKSKTSKHRKGGESRNKE